MSALVHDLLLLARLDAGRPVERAPVDLARLLVDVVSDAHAAGPDHRWRLGLPDVPVVVSGDVASLHQVVANLLTNARTHTPPGSLVVVSLAEERGREAVITVTDDGPGIPAELLPEVFERFTRGDSSRSRNPAVSSPGVTPSGGTGSGGTGLGLAIVSAIVEAHGGSVEVTSSAGGTAVCARLPALASAAEPATQAVQDGVPARGRERTVVAQLQHTAGTVGPPSMET